MKEKRESFFIPDEVLHFLTLKALKKLDEAGADKLSRWMSENPEAEEDCAIFLDSVKKMYWASLSNSTSDPEALINRYFEGKKKTRAGISRIYPYLAVAATVIFLAGFLWYFLFFAKNEDIKTAHTETTLTERQNRAVLVLSDGAIVDLDQSDNKSVSEENGVQIFNLPGEVLRYEQATEAVDENRTNRLIVPAGARYQIQLADGTKVWMNSLSELEYPVSFSAQKRKVKLSGEAYFEVTRNPSAPFTIEANGYEVVVLGTSFNVSAYASDSFIQTTLVTGVVEVNNREGTAYNLDPGQMAMINHDGQEISINYVDTRLYTSWRDGILHFNKITLQELAIKLERWYDVDIQFANEQTSGLLFSGAMENSRDIRFLLTLIGQAANVEFEIVDKQIYVK